MAKIAIDLRLGAGTWDFGVLKNGNAVVSLDSQGPQRPEPIVLETIKCISAMFEKDRDPRMTITGDRPIAGLGEFVARAYITINAIDGPSYRRITIANLACVTDPEWFGKWEKSLREEGSAVLLWRFDPTAMLISGFRQQTGRMYPRTSIHRGRDFRYLFEGCGARFVNASRRASN